MRKNGTLTFVTVVAVVALPAIGVNLAHRYTGNPFLSPLGITQEEIAEYAGPSDFRNIAVYVDWGRDREGQLTKADLRTFVSRAMNARTSDYFIRFREVAGTGIGITLEVGPNRFGPYVPSRLHEGIGAAAAALEMTRRHRG